MQSNNRKTWFVMVLAKLVVVFVAIIAVVELGWELWYVAVALAVWLPLEVALEYRVARRVEALNALGWAAMDLRNDPRRQLKYMMDRLRPFAEELLAAGFNPHMPSHQQPKDIRRRYLDFERLVRRARTINLEVPRSPLAYTECSELYEIPPPPGQTPASRGLFAV